MKGKGRTKNYSDTPIEGRKQEVCLHLCKDTNTAWKVMFYAMAAICAGSLFLIPLFCEILPKEYIGIYTCIDTVVFWLSIVWTFVAKSHMDHDKNIVFVTTDQKLLYALNLNIFFRPKEEIPGSTIGQTIYLHKKSIENEKIQKTLDDFFLDRSLVERLADGMINPSKKEGHELAVALIKFNSPKLKRRIVGTFIKYWDEKKEKWDTFFLPKKTEKYEKICELIKSRNMTL